MYGKKSAILWGIIGGLISVIILRELVKALLVMLILGNDMDILFEGYTLNTVYDPVFIKSEFSRFFLLGSTFLSTIIIIEISAYILKKKNDAEYKAGIIIFQLINLTWLLFGLIFFIISFAFKFSISEEWKIFFDCPLYSRHEQTLIIFLGSFVLFGYISFVLTRIKNQLK